MKRRQKTETKDIVIRRSVRLIGLNEAARLIGVSRTHLSFVLHGKRESKRLIEKIAKLGIKVETAN